MTAEEALFACAFLDENAQIQLQAEIMGGAIALSEDERATAPRGHSTRQFPPLWAFYERKVKLGEGANL
jgi:hypothetical protein